MPVISKLFPTLHMPTKAVIGTTETLEPVGETSFGTTVNGDAILLQPSWGAKYSVSLSNSGDRIWMPSAGDLYRGRVLPYDSMTWHYVTIPGNGAALLLRDPVPGSVHAYDTDDTEVERTVLVNGRSVTILNTGRLTTIAYRWRLTVMIGKLTFGGENTTRNSNWSVDMVEKSAP